MMPRSRLRRLPKRDKIPVKEVRDMAEREWSVKESSGDSGQALIDEQVEYAKYLAKKLEQPELHEEVMKQAYSDFISWFKVEDDALKTGTMHEGTDEI
jgi:hypothetical protein